MESPLNNNIINPLSDYATVPDEYMHGLGAKDVLPKLELKKLATDLVRLSIVPYKVWVKKGPTFKKLGR